MKNFKMTIIGWSIALLLNSLNAQETTFHDSISFEALVFPTKDIVLDDDFGQPITNFQIFKSNESKSKILPLLNPINVEPEIFKINHPSSFLIYEPLNIYSSKNLDLGLDIAKKDFFFTNRRNRYSALWAFTSLNYLYADLVSLMDKNILVQYQNGVVDGLKITPNFLTAAAGFMQIPLSNVFLPQVINNEKTLRWVQIASGTIMTIVQSGTLFVGKPTPYYALFSAIEIGTTAYITIDAIRWKPKRKVKSHS